MCVDLYVMNCVFRKVRNDVCDNGRNTHTIVVYTHTINRRLNQKKTEN